MKKLKFLFCFAISTSIFSQTAASVFTTDSLVYFGLDFSNCRLVGNFGNGDGYAMKTKMFVQWNSIISNERKKYNLNEAFHKSTIYYDLGPVAINNSKADESLIRTSNSGYKLDEKTLQKMISSYETGETKEGNGVVFIVETFDKPLLVATVYVTFFDIATKKILFSGKMKGIPIGGGLGNFWANSMVGILKEIQRSNYFMWKNKYYKMD